MNTSNEAPTFERTDICGNLMVFRAATTDASICAFSDRTLLLSFDEGQSRYGRHMTAQFARALAAELLAAADACEAREAA